MTAVAVGRRLRVLRVTGLLPYAAGAAWQQALASRLSGGADGPDAADTLLLVEHPPVFTVGKRGTVHNVLSSASALRALGAEAHSAPRGGDATFHGPGQLVAYPVVRLRRLGVGARAYVEGLEDAVAAAARAFGVPTAAGRVPGAPGVWVADRKLAAVGVRISGGVATHGAALNVSTDLSWFNHVVPCGIVGKGVTSLLRETGAAPTLDEAAAVFAAEFAAEFGFEATDTERVAACDAATFGI